MFTECFLCVDLVLYVLHAVSHLLPKPVKEEQLLFLLYKQFTGKTVYREVKYFAHK